MKKYRNLLLPLALTLTLPAFAQEEMEEPADEAMTEDASTEATDESATGESSGDDAIATTPTEETGSEDLDTVAVNEGDEAAEDAEPLELYVGVDYAATTLSASTLDGFPTGQYDSGMYRLRVGTQLIEEVGVEFHYGFDNSDDGEGDVATDNYYGLYVVPAANLFDWVELAFPIGYGRSSVERNGADEDLGSIAYGLNAELPLRKFGEDWPDLRLGAGWMVYYQKSDARLYGWNAGVRYDFEAGNPFAGFELDLWPFGDDQTEDVD